MIEHIVLFRFKPETSDATKTKIIQELLDLRSRIPSIRDIRAGANFCDRSKGYDYALVVRFTDRQGLDEYQEHPDHQKVVVEWVRPNLAEILAVDYEFQG